MMYCDLLTYLKRVYIYTIYTYPGCIYCMYISLVASVKVIINDHKISQQVLVNKYLFIALLLAVFTPNNQDAVPIAFCSHRDVYQCHHDNMASIDWWKHIADDSCHEHHIARHHRQDTIGNRV